MGLTFQSVGRKASKNPKDKSESDIRVLLAGNPNVGKSSIFNCLTGLKQHTGNWPGKTVSNAVGFFKHRQKRIAVTDLPGTYSLLPHSEEEIIARDEICFGENDVVVVVCDATTIEKSLSLCLQVLEITNNVVVCLNLIDQAKKKGIEIDKEKLSDILGVAVIETSAKSKKGIEKLKDEIVKTALKNEDKKTGLCVEYRKEIEEAAKMISSSNFEQSRFSALRALTKDKSYFFGAEKYLKIKFENDEKLKESVKAARDYLLKRGFSVDKIRDEISISLVKKAFEIKESVVISKSRTDKTDRILDKIFSGKYTAIPIMLIFVFGIFFLTIYAANYPSRLLSQFLFFIGERLRDGFDFLGFPWWITQPLIDGVWCVMSWVVSVMLVPMLIFFPLFTLLEDFGYLPRMAFNLDRLFQKCNSCGKQSLCMCMGLGCNAAGVIGCRIIDSKRERLIAAITNSLMPCNGRFPSIIALISIFFVCSFSGLCKSLTAALILTMFLVLCIIISLASSYFLSKTVFKGQPSAFTLELPSYRAPKICSIVIRSVFDRAVFVLARAVSISAPMGLLIWILANVKIVGSPIIDHLSSFLNPIGQLMGLDGVILLAFFLGFPANEIVLPIALMCYTSQGVLCDASSYETMLAILSQNGWTYVTALCFIFFSLFHFPCSTTLLSIKKETKSLKYTALSFALPTAIGFIFCTAINLVFSL